MTDTEYVPYDNASPLNVGEGWQPIIEKALTAIRLIDPGATVVQIKEKFGGLRLYMQPSEDAIDEVKWAVGAIASQAENDASNRCEECGGFPARNEPIYKWYRTLCPDHRAQAWIAAHERMSSPASEFPVSAPVDPPMGMCPNREPHEPHLVEGEYPYSCIGQVEFPSYDDVIDPDEPTPEGWGEDAETDENEERGDLAMAVREAGHPDVADEIGGMSIEDAREVAGEFVPDHVEGD